MSVSIRATAIRRTLYLMIALLIAFAALLMAERSSGSDFPTTLIKKGTTSGVPSNGHHNGPGDHCNDNHGNDANKNKHCLAGQSS